MTQRETKSTLAAGTSVSGQAVTLTNVVSGRLITVGCFCWTDNTAATLSTTASDNQGNTLARDSHSELTNASDRWMAAVYSLILPASYATYTVTVTMASGGAVNQQYEVVMLENSATTTWVGVDQIASNSNTTATTAPTSGTTPTNGADTRYAIAAYALCNSNASNTITQNGGANWPTASTTPDTDGETAASATNNSTGQAGMVATSMNTAHQSATSSDAWTTTSARFCACIATYKEAAAGGGEPFPAGYQPVRQALSTLLRM